MRSAKLEKLLLAVGKSAIIFWQSHAIALGVGIIAIYFVGIVLVSWIIPGANWDMVAYVAAALDYNQLSATELHSKAWEAVRGRVSDGEFLVLTSDRPYRIVQFESPSAFVTMLGFYKVKVLYVAIASWLTGIMQPVDALRLISTLSAALIGMVVFVWSFQRKFTAWAPVIVAFFILSDFGNVARHVAPDLLAAFFLIYAAFAYLKRQDTLCAVSLILAFLTRPDHLAFIAVLAMVASQAGEGSRRLLIAFLGCFVSYFAITSYAGHPGWWTQLWFTQIEYVPNLEGFDPEFSVFVYGKIVIQALVRSMIDETWLAVFVLQCIVIAFLFSNIPGFEKRQIVLIFSIIVSTAAKFAIAPMHETRFYVAYLIIFGLVIVEIAARCCKSPCT